VLGVLLEHFTTVRRRKTAVLKKALPPVPVHRYRIIGRFPRQYYRRVPVSPDMAYSQRHDVKADRERLFNGLMSIIHCIISGNWYPSAGLMQNESHAPIHEITRNIEGVA
jgi:hypothetical protein